MLLAIVLRCCFCAPQVPSNVFRASHLRNVFSHWWFVFFHLVKFKCILINEPELHSSLRSCSSSLLPTTTFTCWASSRCYPYLNLHLVHYPKERNWSRAVPGRTSPETAPFHHSSSFTSILCSISSLIVVNWRNATLLCRVLTIFIRKSCSQTLCLIGNSPYYINTSIFINEACNSIKNQCNISLAKPIFHKTMLTGMKYATFKFFNACIQYQSFHNWTQNQYQINWLNTTWGFPSTPVQMLAQLAILFSLVESSSCSKISFKTNSSRSYSSHFFWS